MFLNVLSILCIVGEFFSIIILFNTMDPNLYQEVAKWSLVTLIAVSATYAIVNLVLAPAPTSSTTVTSPTISSPIVVDPPLPPWPIVQPYLTTPIWPLFTTSPIFWWMATASTRNCTTLGMSQNSTLTINSTISNATAAINNSSKTTQSPLSALNASNINTNSTFNRTVATRTFPLQMTSINATFNQQTSSAISLLLLLRQNSNLSLMCFLLFSFFY